MKTSPVLKLAALATLSGWLIYSAPAYANEVCTFDDWAWHSAEGRATSYETVRTHRDQLKTTQYHPTLPCSVCREDQIRLKLSNGHHVTVCKAIAPEIGEALEMAIEAGFQIQTLKGYRVGRTRGALDSRGLRTEYSNHSYGLAIDINSEANGLYDHCAEWGPKCRLRQGGEWDSNNPLSVTRHSSAYEALTSHGFQWGGELSGRQKDYMHFSLTGD